MSKHPTTPLAIAVSMLCIGLAAQAQTTAPAAATAAETATPTVTPSSSNSSYGFMGGMFSAPGTTGGLNQLSSTPSYELTGIGRRSDAAEASILTVPGNGVPVRFENGVFVYLSALAGLGHNSNLTGVNSGVIASNLYSLQPDVVAELKNRGDRYTLHYSGNYTHYFSSGDDDFKHHFLNAAGDNYFSSRSRLGWDVGYIDRTDPRGSTSVTTASTPNRWTAPTARAIYTYGAKEAQGRIEVEGNYISKKYQNNQASTAILNNDQAGVSGRFFYRVMPRTSLIFELRQTHTSYANNPGFTNNDTRGLVGVTWDATAKTSGTFKIGSAQKKFSDSTIGKATGVTWEGSVRWSPLTYSTFDLITNRAVADSTGSGNYLLNTGNSIAWNHQWRSNLSSRATLGTLKTDFSGVGRIDNTDNAGIGVFYDVGRNWRAGAEWAYTKRKSNQAAFEYSRNTTFFSLQGTL